MDKHTSARTLKKYSESVTNFLDKHRIDQGDSYTHLSYGSYQGRMKLDTKEKLKEFYKVYCEAIENGVENLSILEKQQEYAPIIVDIDIEVPIETEKEDEEPERYYTESMVKKIIIYYFEAIYEYLNPSEGDMIASLFEKKAPTKKDTKYKEGFHIIFHRISAQTNVRHLIRKHVVEKCEQSGLFEDFGQSADKIIDIAVVSRNSWFMYGSKKSGSFPYRLTKIYSTKKLIYDHDLGEHYSEETGEVVDTNKFTNTSLIKNYSLYNPLFTKKNATPFADNITESEIYAKCEEIGIVSSVKAEQVKYEISSKQDDDIRRATKYVAMLTENRADDYHEWIKVGLALHNVHNSMLPTWIEFSKMSKKFKAGECEKSWDNFKTPSNTSVLTIRSLAYWARKDDPKRYEQFVKEEFANNMKNCLTKTTYSLAKLAYTKYSERFVCSSIKNNSWWKFENHRWKRNDQGYSLKMLFSEDLSRDFEKEIGEIAIKSSNLSGVEREELQNRKKSLDGILNSLLDSAFKDKLLGECKSIFYDEGFEEKLDSNPMLLGCSNGTLDLTSGEFRDGRPDDYIKMDTKTKYYKYNPRNPFNPKIQGFLSQIFPNANVRKYMTVVLSTCVAGETREEKVYVLTGTGANGKSLLMDLMKLAFGEYYMTCPISILTKKRGQSNEASPEKVRMKGRRTGAFQETDDGDKLNVGVMKEMSGGDEFLIRDLFKGSEEMLSIKPQMKYFIICNQLPDVPSNDDGTWRRLRKIDFIAKFISNPKKENEFLVDPKLKEKIKDWAEAFLSYLVHIYLTEYKNGGIIQEPEEVLEATREYKKANDYYTDFYDSNIIKTQDKKDKVTKATLWNRFKDWIKDISDGKTKISKKEFDTQMDQIMGKCEGSYSKFWTGYALAKLENQAEDTEVSPIKPSDLDG